MVAKSTFAQELLHVAVRRVLVDADQCLSGSSGCCSEQASTVSGILRLGLRESDTRHGRPARSRPPIRDTAGQWQRTVPAGVPRWRFRSRRHDEPGSAARE